MTAGDAGVVWSGTLEWGRGLLDLIDPSFQWCGALPQWLIVIEVSNEWAVREEAVIFILERRDKTVIFVGERDWRSPKKKKKMEARIDN